MLVSLKKTLTYVPIWSLMFCYVTSFNSFC